MATILDPTHLDPDSPSMLDYLAREVCARLERDVPLNVVPRQSLNILKTRVLEVPFAVFYDRPYDGAFLNMLVHPLAEYLKHARFVKCAEYGTPLLLVEWGQTWSRITGHHSSVTVVRRDKMTFVIRFIGEHA